MAGRERPQSAKARSGRRNPGGSGRCARPASAGRHRDVTSVGMGDLSSSPPPKGDLSIFDLREELGGDSPLVDEKEDLGSFGDVVFNEGRSGRREYFGGDSSSGSQTKPRPASHERQRPRSAFVARLHQQTAEGRQSYPRPRSAHISSSARRAAAVSQRMVRLETGWNSRFTAADDSSVLDRSSSSSSIGMRAYANGSSSSRQTFRSKHDMLRSRRRQRHRPRSASGSRRKPTSGGGIRRSVLRPKSAGGGGSRKVVQSGRSQPLQANRQDVKTRMGSRAQRGRGEEDASTLIGETGGREGFDDTSTTSALGPEFGAGTGGSAVSGEAYFSHVVDRIRALWAQVQVPQRDRTFFANAYFRESNQANIKRCDAQLDLLLGHKQATIEVLRNIEAREIAKRKLLRLCSHFHGQIRGTFVLKEGGKENSVNTVDSRNKENSMSSRPRPKSAGRSRRSEAKTVVGGGVKRPASAGRVRGGTQRRGEAVSSAGGPGGKEDPSSSSPLANEGEWRSAIHAAALETRNATLLVVESIVEWRKRLWRAHPFVWKGTSYIERILQEGGWPELWETAFGFGGPDATDANGDLNVHTSLGDEKAARRQLKMRMRAQKRALQEGRGAVLASLCKGSMRKTLLRLRLPAETFELVVSPRLADRVSVAVTGSYAIKGTPDTVEQKQRLQQAGKALAGERDNQRVLSTEMDRLLARGFYIPMLRWSPGDQFGGQSPVQRNTSPPRASPRATRAGDSFGELSPVRTADDDEEGKEADVSRADGGTQLGETKKENTAITSNSPGRVGESKVSSTTTTARAHKLQVDLVQAVYPSRSGVTGGVPAPPAPGADEATAGADPPFSGAASKIKDDVFVRFHLLDPRKPSEHPSNSKTRFLYESGRRKHEGLLGAVWDERLVLLLAGEPLPTLLASVYTATGHGLNEELLGTTEIPLPTLATNRKTVIDRWYTFGHRLWASTSSRSRPSSPTSSASSDPANAGVLLEGDLRLSLQYV